MALLNTEQFELIEKLGLLFLGWLLGLTTTVARNRYRVRTLKRSLEREISDAKGWLLNSKRHLEYMIQLCAVGKTANYGPVKIPVHVYKNNFAEAALKLNEGERGSFHAIYTRIEELNEKYDELINLNRACAEDDSEMRQLAGALELYYTTVWTTLHLINFHLRNKARLDKAFHHAPELGEGEAQNMYQQVNTRLMELANEARELGPERITENSPDRVRR